MPEILTESFCERCGTKYTLGPSEEIEKPAGVKRAKLLAKGFKNFVLSNDAFEDALAAAELDEDRERAAAQMDAFHQVFNFCMECRQYTCTQCWNQDEGRCLTCAPLPYGIERDPLFKLGELAPSGAPEVGDNGAHGPVDASAWPTVDLRSQATKPVEPADIEALDLPDWLQARRTPEPEAAAATATPAVEGGPSAAEEPAASPAEAEITPELAVAEGAALGPAESAEPVESIEPAATAAPEATEPEISIAPIPAEFVVPAETMQPGQRKRARKEHEAGPLPGVSWAEWRKSLARGAEAAPTPVDATRETAAPAAGQREGVILEPILPDDTVPQTDEWPSPQLLPEEEAAVGFGQPEETAARRDIAPADVPAAALESAAAAEPAAPVEPTAAPPREEPAEEGSAGWIVSRLMGGLGRKSREADARRVERAPEAAPSEPQPEPQAAESTGVSAIGFPEPEPIAPDQAPAWAHAEPATDVARDVAVEYEQAEPLPAAEAPLAPEPEPAVARASDEAFDENAPLAAARDGTSAPAPISQPAPPEPQPAEDVITADSLEALLAQRLEQRRAEERAEAAEAARRGEQERVAAEEQERVAATERERAAAEGRRRAAEEERRAAEAARLAAERAAEERRAADERRAEEQRRAEEERRARPATPWDIVAPETPPAEEHPSVWPPRAPVYQPPAQRPSPTGAPGVPTPPAAQPQVPPAALASQSRDPRTWASAQSGAASVWEESSRGIISRPGSGVQACVSCGLALSASARFCRRCGTRQG